MSNTKRNTTKKAPEKAVQSDKVQGNTAVASTTKRATKPSVVALQKEVESLKQQLVDSHQHVVRLKEESQERWCYYAELVSRPLSLIIYQRFTDWLYNVTKNFRE